MKALVTDTVHEILIKQLEAAKVEVDYHPKINDKEVRKMVSGYDILIINSKVTVDKEMFELAPRLRIVGRLGSGMEIIDQQAAREHGVVCLNSPEGNRLAVAEHCIGLLFNLSNNIKAAGRDIENGIWDREGNRGWEMSGRVAGIIGCGNTGSETAKRFAALGMHVLAYDKYRDGFSKNDVSQSTMTEIFDRAEIVSLHLPYTSETHHLADSEFFQRFEKEIWFLNTSRGAVTKSVDLLAALENGKVKGAGLDVFEEEGSPQFFENSIHKELKSRANVILTPHIAGWTIESKYKLAVTLVKKVMRYL